MMNPSAGVSKTTSASFNPLWGRAAPGSFPILMAMAGRFGTPPLAGRSVSGQFAFGTDGRTTFELPPPVIATAIPAMRPRTTTAIAARTLLSFGNRSCGFFRREEPEVFLAE